MDILIYIGYVVATFGPIIAYAIYTSLRGEPRRADKPVRSKRSSKLGGATS